MMNSFKTFLEKKIQKRYKSKTLKLIYGIIFFRNIKDNQFALENGVITVLSFYRIFRQKNINSSFVKTRFNNTCLRYEKTVLSGNYAKGELGGILEKLDFYINKNRIINCLELGCGTGLVGEKIFKRKIILTGVDTSENMLKIARSKNIYKELHCSDIENYLSLEKNYYDLIFASSVIQFFDDKKLNSLFSLIQNRLNENWVFVFTFDFCDKGIRLNSKLFMEHSLKYMEITAKKFFKSIELEELEFGRLEQG